MGVTIGTYLGETLNPPQPGWTVITEAVHAPDITWQDGFNLGAPNAGTTMKIYVSKSGSDGASATEGSSTNPYLTVAHAMSRLRSSSPDWILFKCGDTWTDTDSGPDFGSSGSLFQFPAGLDAQNPMVITSYGTGARPLFKYSPPGTAVVLGSGGGSAAVINHIAMIGLEFINYTRDPTNATSFTMAAAFAGGGSCFGWANSFDLLLIENCKFSYYSLNLNVEPAESLVYTGTGFYLRRNVILDAYPGTGRSQGIFFANIQPDGWTFEENVLDFNGGNATLSQGVSVTTDSTADTVTYALSLPVGNVTPPNGSTVVFTTSGGGIVANTNYMTTGLSGNTLQLLLSGSPVNITANVSLTCVWTDPGPSVGNRNCYAAAHGIDGKGIWRGNLSTRSSSDGGQIRMGGDIYNNLFAYNASGFSGPAPGQTDTPSAVYLVFSDNVITNSDNVDVVPVLSEGNGAALANCVGGTIQIKNNLMLNDSSLSRSGNAVSLGRDVVNGQVFGNIAYNYGFGFSSDGIGGVLFAGLTITNSGSGYTDGTFYENVSSTNVSAHGTGLSFWVTIVGGQVTEVLPGAVGQNYQIGDTVGLDPSTGENCVEHHPMGGAGSGFVATITLVGNTSTASLGPNTEDLAGANPGHIFPDPSRTIETYDSIVLSGPGTFSHFIGLARLQAKNNWNSALTADQINDWIQAGFTSTTTPLPGTKPGSRGHIHHNINWRSVR